MLAAALTVAARTGTATLGQAQRVGAALDGLAGELAHTANYVGATLHGLTQDRQDAGHF